MRVHLIKEKTILDYGQNHASSISGFERWIHRVKNADWNSPNDFNTTFANADLLGKKSKRVCFDVGGNNHRIICSYYFNKNIDKVTLFIKWIGTHAEYDGICKKNEQYTIDKF